MLLLFAWRERGRKGCLLLTIKKFQCFSRGNDHHCDTRLIIIIILLRAMILCLLYQRDDDVDDQYLQKNHDDDEMCTKCKCVVSE